MPKYPVPFVMPGVDVADADAAVGNVLNPRTFYSVAPPRKTGIMPTVALNPALNVYPTGYHAGAASLTTVDADLIKESIKAGVTIFGVGGIIIPSLEIRVPATLGSVDAEAIVPVNQSYNKNVPLTSPYNKAYDDQPGENIRRLTPAIALSKTHVIVPVNQSYNKNAPVGREGGVQMLVDGAVADDGGAQTDETAAARSPAVNDMTLLPVLPVAGDAYYIGFNYPFNRVWLNIGTAGNGNWALVEEYWNGAWAALAGVIDNTNEFTVAGLNSVSFTKPGDWALTSILGMNLYWIRFRVSAFVSIVTQPLGTQGWCEVLA